MPLTNQEKGKRCEDSWEPILRASCPVDLQHLRQGADFKCKTTLYEIKSCRSRLTSKQRETKVRVEKSGGKYHVLRCPCEKDT